MTELLIDITETVLEVAGLVAYIMGDYHTAANAWIWALLLVLWFDG